MARASTFTSYINAQIDPGLEQAYNKQATIAEASYGRISRAAADATRATAGLLGGRGTAGISNAGTRALDDRSAATKRIASASAEAERATARLTPKIAQQGQAAREAAKGNQALAQSLTTTATVLNVVQGPLGPLAGRVGALSRAIQELSGFRLGLAAVGATLFSFGRLASSYQNLEARVRPFFETQQQTNQAMSDIVGIANRAKSALEPVVDVYARLTTVGRDIGLGTQSIARFTELTTKAANIGGGDQASKGAALMQFGQGLSGNFQGAGQEINSLKEQAPILFSAILKGYKDVDGTIGVTIGRFRELQEAGKLSTQGVLDAVERSAGYINQMSGRIGSTLTSSATKFGAAVTTQIGAFDKLVGFTSVLGSTLSLAADNLRVIIALAVGVGAAFAAVKIGGLVADTALAITRTAALNAQTKAVGLSLRENAIESATSHVKEIVALEAEKREILQKIALQERLIALSRADRLRAAPDQVAGFAGSSRVQSAALEEEARAARKVAEARSRLTVIGGQLEKANAGVASSTATIGKTLEVASAKTNIFKTGAMSLISFLGGPWVVGITLAVGAIYLLATAETAAEAATRKNEEAQRSFADTIDATTGKVREQIGELEKLANKRLQSATVATQAGQFTSKRDAFLDRVNDFARPVNRADAAAYSAATGQALPAELRDNFRSAPRTAEQKQLASLVDDVRAGRQGSFAKLEKALGDLGPKIQGLNAALPSLTTLAKETRQGATDFRQAAARDRVSSGRAREGDLDLAAGRVRQGTVGKPLSRTQLNDQAALQAAQSALETAKIELRMAQKAGPMAGEDPAAYTKRIAGMIQNVKALTEAEKENRKAASAGRAEARKQESLDRQSAIQAAAAKRDTDLAGLYEQKLSPLSTEYINQRDKILESYDAEVAKLRGLANAHTSTAAAAAADAKATAKYAESFAETRKDILSAYEDAPKAAKVARDKISQLQAAVAVSSEVEKRGGQGFYSQAQANADQSAIERGLRRPLEEARREASQSLEVGRLSLAGNEREAEALRRTLALYNNIGTVRLSDYQTYLGIVQQEEALNRQLEKRQRLMDELSGVLESSRGITQTLFEEIGAGNKNALDNLRDNLKATINRIAATSITDRIFSGADQKLKDLVSGRTGVDSAIASYISSLEGAENETVALGEATRTLTSVMIESANSLKAGVTLSGAPSAAATGGGPGGIVGAITSAAATAATKAANDNGGENEIVVVARKLTNTLDGGKSLFSGDITGLDKLSRGIGKDIGKALGIKDGGLGETFGKALKGAGTGTLVSGIADAVGVKLSGTGAQIGGAIGGATGLPGGDIIGSILGGIVGTIFKGKPALGGTVLTSVDGVDGGAYGRKGGLENVRAVGDAVQEGLSSLVSALGGTAGAFRVGIGNVEYNGQSIYRVSAGGKYNVGDKDYYESGAAAGDVIYDGTDAAEATRIAILNAIQDGAIQGITQASKNILAAGTDLQKSLEKALAIESIPKRLRQRLDPVGYAVDELNKEFSNLISYLKEGSATAEQFADAQKLYELERADAIKNATGQAASAIDALLKEMTSSSSSPLNKRTVYQNAAGNLSAFTADIAAGKSVDNDKLVEAARAFQDASRALNGSSSAFFNDFDMLKALLEQARTNTGVAPAGSTLADSPFTSDSSVQAILSTLASKSTADTQQQTVALLAGLDSIVAAIRNIAATGASQGVTGALTSLPGFQAAA